MQIQIEPEITKDLIQKIFCLYDENFSPTVKVPHTKIKKRILQNVYKVIIIKNQDEWIGFSLVNLHKPLQTIFIDYLCVDKKFQKGGFGKRILQMLNDKNQMYKDYKYTALECENYLVPYYQKNNYKKIPLAYPIDNPTPLYMLCRERTSCGKKIKTEMYHRLIQFGLLFNGEIIICLGLFVLWLKMFLFVQDQNMTKIILNFKSTHT